MRWSEMPRWRESSVIALSRSPDGAKRNPGIVPQATGVPDYAALHPGYGRKVRAFSSCHLLRAVHPAARDVQKHLLQRGAVVARHDGFGRIVVLDTAALHDDDAVAEPLDLEHVVRGQEDGGVVRLTVTLQMASNPVGGVGIERGGRLIQQQQLGLVDQRFGKRNARLLSCGELAVGAVDELGEVEVA